jgi:FkbM family methyltransferase
LGATSGTIELFDVDPTLGPHPLDVSIRDGRGPRFDVPLRRLDELIEGGVAMLKVDVEGAELDVLRGAGRVLASRPLIFVEVLQSATLDGLSGLVHDYSFEECGGHNVLASPH